MAKILGFRGLRYDLERAGDPSDLLAPPYDVIDDAGRAKLAGKSPHNCVHVILPEGEGDTRYENGRAALEALQQDALTRDDEPSLYIYHQRFESEGKRYVRKGLVCLIELTHFGDGPVLPHERTLAGPKQDRLKLMRACDAHLELVFGMFSDPGRSWESALGQALEGEPVLATSFDGVEHTLWKVGDADAVAGVQAVLADKNIYIADGHHRYETMCTFADELGEAGRGDASRYGMIYLSNLDDPGLVVLPTHRVVHGLAGVDLASVVQAISAHFDVEEVDLPGTPAQLRQTLITAGAERAAFGLSVPGSGRMTLLRLKADFDPEAAGLGDLHPALNRLDVALLHELVLERALGISKQAQADKTNLRYLKKTHVALAAAQGSAPDLADTQLCCFMNATPVSDVMAVCDSGQVMPQKSTFFFPKIPTGLVFRTID